jgi:release factor glutamine methyltransferase
LAALAEAAGALQPVSDTPRLDAELLLAHALGVERGALLLDPQRFTAPGGYADMIARRIAHEPVAYIIGHQDFWTIRLKVGPGVLIPRSDSETLIEAAVVHFGPDDSPQTILDLGTGPGTLLLAALDHWRGASGVGVDRSSRALAYAKNNAVRLGLTARTQFICGDWGDGGQADLILCNPPYVEEGAALDAQVRLHEPGEALFAGPDGLDAYRVLIPRLPAHLTDRGVILLEIGMTQAAAVSALAAASGFAVSVRQDLTGRDRALLLTRL